MSLKQNFQTINTEYEFKTCRVEGEIPESLSGTLYRNGPGVFERYGESYGHWFGGHGVINATRFSAVEGEDQVKVQAETAVKIVETKEYKAEKKKQKALYSSYGKVLGSNFFKRLLPIPKNAANTSVLFWQNKLFALEEGHLATELDPHTLETKAETNLAVKKMERFSAHPSWVTDLQCGFNFGLTIGRNPKLQIFKLPKAGGAELMAEHALPGNCYMHDFIATNTHLIFFIMPIRLNTKDFLLGRKSFAEASEWKPELNTQICAVPIENPNQKVVIETKPLYTFHFANAFDTSSDEIVVDYIHYDDFSLHDKFYDIQNSIDSIHNAGGTLNRITLNLSEKTANHEVLTDTLGEFPIVPPAYQGKPAPCVYLADINKPNKDTGKNRSCIIRYDYKTQEEAIYDFADGVHCSEPIFVEDKTADDKSDATDGYLLTLTYDSNTHDSYIAILDANQLEKGVLAKVYFEQNIPLGFHGRWVSANAVT